MKHPVLRVKKGFQKYDDTEEKSETFFVREVPEPARRRSGMFRARRTSLLTVLVLVVIAVALLRLLPQFAARADIAGWHAVLEARAAADSLEVGVAFSRRVPAGQSAGGLGTDVSVLFVLAGTHQQSRVIGRLSGDRVALVSRLPYTGMEKIVQAIVRINGESKMLSLPLSGRVFGP